jgi:hypothetical protein
VFQSLNTDYSISATQLLGPWTSYTAGGHNYAVAGLDHSTFTFTISNATSGTVQVSTADANNLEWSVDGGAYATATIAANGQWHFVPLPSAALDGGTHTVVGCVPTGNYTYLDRNNTLQVSAGGIVSNPLAITQTAVVGAGAHLACYGPWIFAGIQAYSLGYSDCAIQFRAQCSQIGVWAGQNGNAYRLAIDGVLQPIVELPNNGEYGEATLATGLDSTAEHIYTIWGVDPQSLLSVWAVLTAGGPGVDTTYVPPAPNYRVGYGDSITYGAFVGGDSTQGWYFQSAQLCGWTPYNLGVVGESYSDIAKNPSKLAAVQTGVVGQSWIYTALGVNDEDQYRGPDTMAQLTSNVAWYCGQVRSFDANIKHVVLGILPYTGTNDTTRGAWNTAIQQGVADAGDSRTVYGGVCNAIDPATDTHDGIHLNESGGAKVAAWFRVNVFDIASMEAPAAGSPGEWIPVVLTPNPSLVALAKPVTFTLSDGGAGGLFSSPSIVFPAGSAQPQIVHYQSSTAGTATVSAQNDSGEASPDPVAISITTGVTGNVALEGLVSSAALQTVNFQFSGAGSFVQSCVTDSSGAFCLPGVPDGNYTVRIKGKTWLSRTVPLTVSGGYGVIDVTLLSGDVNGDDAVNLSDWSELAAAFGSDPSLPNWDSNADLNGDGVVDVTDFSLLAQNFGQEGD